MRHRTKTLQEGTWYKLTQHSKKNRGKYYTVRVSWLGTKVTPSEMREHFDPGKNRGPQHGYSWKFSDRKTAEQLIMLAILKWGA